MTADAQPLDPAMLAAFVQSFVDRREEFLALRAEHGSPLYVLERDVLRDRARTFGDAFRRELPDVRVFYAMKSNNCPDVAATLAEAGLGLDVSSGVELEVALGCATDTIVFSGPGKTDDELRLAVTHRDRVTVLMDSFSELERLERVAAAAGATVRAGVRLTTDENGLWRKFGIPLRQLARFIEAAGACAHVALRGLQFHTSWNMNPENHAGFVERLGDTLATLPAARRAQIEFIDVGGGFWPPQGEWLHGPAGPDGLARPHLCVPSTPIDGFARRIGEAVRTRILPHVRCRICMEPGRWICNDAMHILLTVIDRKADDMVVTDAGTNTIGWERYETDYFPVINLSRPSLDEHPCYVLGSLCTPHDVWGYAFHGTDIRPGDALLIPTQGAYTFSLRQNFIKPIAKLVAL